jgi:CubicO group peptidase (beta-lactamase class C family)
MGRSRLPRDLESVTSINSAAEVEPRDVGMSRDEVEQIWRTTVDFYRTGFHPAVQLCVRRHGQVVLDRAIGHAAGNGPDDPVHAPKRLATPATPFTIFSASKAVTAMLIHLLDQRRDIHLSDPVCEYIPEFASHHKEWITIQQLLTHRAGIPNLPPGLMDLDLLHEEDAIVRALCDAKPMWRPGRWLGYHAITGGFILGEVVKRVTGLSIRAFIEKEILKPLGFRWLNFGVRSRDVGQVALNYMTGPTPRPPISTVLHRALGAPLKEVVEISNDPRFLTAVVPSGNTVATANDLSRFYQLLLNGGELDGKRIFEPRTIRRASSEQSYFEFDSTLIVPIRYGMGFMLGAKWFSLYGPDTNRAFGHIGLSNIISWADPERQVAAALMTNGKPLLHPGLYALWNVTRQVGLSCSKERRRGAAPRRKLTIVKRAARRPKKSQRAEPRKAGGRT